MMAGSVELGQGPGVAGPRARFSLVLVRPSESVSRAGRRDHDGRLAVHFRLARARTGGRVDRWVRACYQPGPEWVQRAQALASRTALPVSLQAEFSATTGPSESGRHAGPD